MVPQKCKKGNLCHCNHLPVSCKDIVSDKNSISTVVCEEVKLLIDSGASNNVIRNQIRSKFQTLLTSSLIREFRSDRIESLIEENNDGNVPKSSIDRLIRMFQSMKNVSYVYVKHNIRNGFVTYHGDTTKQSNFDDGMNMEIREWRKNLAISGSEDILVSFAWSHDVEKRQMLMFPEFIAVDMTFGLNREKRNLLTFVGIDGDNRSFNGCRYWMPSKQTVAYRWAINVALPSLIGKKGEFLLVYSYSI